MALLFKVLVVADIFYKLEDLKYTIPKFWQSVFKADIHYYISEHVSFTNISAYN